MRQTTAGHLLELGLIVAWVAVALAFVPLDVATPLGITRADHPVLHFVVMLLWEIAV